MWFGDLVTMKWWNDLWLNESFAEWASTIATAEATEWTEAWTTFNAMEKSWAYRQDQLPSTHPVVATINDLEDVQVNFDGITYAKGGSVLKQLVAWVGIDAFFAGRRARTSRSTSGATPSSPTCSPSSRRPSGRDLADWSKHVARDRGRQHAASRDRDRRRRRDHVVRASLQSAHRRLPDDPPAPPRDRLLQPRTAASSCATHRVELDVDGERTEVAELVGRTRPDLVLLNDDDLAYAKIRLDDASLDVAIAHLADIEDPLARALVWGCGVGCDARRRGRARATTSTSCSATSRPRPSRPRCASTLAQLRARRERLRRAREAGRDASRASPTRSGQLAQEAEAGSDAQFQFVKFFADHRVDAGARRRARRRCCDGTLDARRASRSTPTSAGSCSMASCSPARRRRRDRRGASRPTTPRTGQQSAAQARPRSRRSRASSAPGRRSSTTTTARTRSCATTALGLPPRERPGPARGVRRAVLRRCSLPIWEERSYAIAEKLIVGLYPSPLANRALADATRAWLDANPDVPALRRLVVENLAGVERALAAQERDAQDA